MDLKYHRFVSLLLSTNDHIGFLKKNNNHLILRIISVGGEVLLSIKETIKEGESDIVSIVYSIKDNPTYKDFDLRFLYSGSICLNDPEFVVSSINQRIKEFLISQLI